MADLRQTLQGEGARIVAESTAMKKALDLLSRAAAADTPVLLLGESGTGKELFARALHAQSRRRTRRFTAVNCSAIPEALLESHLFGHKRGAFTDAREDRRGLFQETEGGTMLLDEIGDMPPALQSKLLRVLQEGEVHPLGASAPVPVDVRIVAATHRDLEALIAEERFRLDLFYRLNVIAIRIPPLRDRPEDLVPLTAHFLDKHGRRLGRGGCTLSAETLVLFQRYGWPGNVRELENVIERALVLDRDDVLASDDLPEALRRGGLVGTPNTLRALPPLAEMEREHILKALRAARGNKAAAARLLGMDRKTLYRKLKQFGIHRP
jgi:two-component system response regulator HydG